MVQHNRLTTPISAEQLRLLQSQRGYPLVTIAMPTHRTFPENQQDPIRFKDLVRQVRDRLAKELSKRDVEHIYHRLATLQERIDWAHTLDGLIVFLGNGIEQIVYLPTTVRERAIIDQTFATRDLVVAQSKLFHYWVLVLSTNRTRLFECYGQDVEEVFSDYFPFPYDGPRSGDPENPLPGGFGINPSAYRDEQYRHYFRRVSDALRQTIGEHQPLIVIGVERNRAFFAEVRSHHFEIVAELDGNLESATPYELAQRIKPALEQYHERCALAALEEFDSAIKDGRYTCSLADMWHFARQGRAALLIVERDFAVAGRWDAEHRTFTLVDDPTEPGVIDDVVDDIIEATLQHKGRVVFVSPGQMEHCEHIGMVLRY